MHKPKPHFIGRPAKVHLGGTWFLFLECIHFRAGAITIDTPKYVVSDLATVPRPLRWLAPKADDWIRACGVHDYLCASGIVPRWIADALFVPAMRADGLSEWRIPLMYLGVRIGAYLPGRSRPPEYIIERARKEIHKREGYHLEPVI